MNEAKLYDLDYQSQTWILTSSFHLLDQQLKLTKKQKITGLVLLLIIAVAYYLSLGSQPSYPPPQMQEKAGIRVLTQNIAHGRGDSFHQLISSQKSISVALNTIGDFLKDYKIDIALFQEIDFDAPWTSHVNQLDAIKQQSGLQHGYQGNNNTKEGFLQHKYGNAILSNLPADASRNNPFSETKLGGKGFLYARFTISETMLHVISLHLHPYDEAEKRKQLESISQFLESLPDETILIGGDFNMTPTNPLITEFMKKHQLTRSDQPKANDPTFVAFGSKQLDYFLHTKNCHIVQLEVVKHNLSDHYGVVVDLEINPTK